MLRRALLPVPLILGCSEAFKGGAGPGKQGEDSADTAIDSEVGVPGEGTVSGVVTDADGLPMEGVTVSDGTSTSTTDGSGAFALEVSGSVTATFSRPGYHGVTRHFDARTRVRGRVSLLPVALGDAVDVALGGTVSTAAGDNLHVPALALGTVGLASVTLDAWNLAAAGSSALPDNAGSAGEIPFVYAVATVDWAGVDGTISPAEPLTVALAFSASSPGQSSPVLLLGDDGWTEVGSADVGSSGGSYVASFQVSTPGTYAVGHLSDGCVSGQVLDGDGSPVSGATVRSYLRPLSGAPSGWIDDTTTAADGRFTLEAPSLGVRVIAEGTDGSGLVTYASTDGNGSGSGVELSECADLGTLALSAGGCATGNLYAADSSRPLANPFAWDEGDVAYSADDSTLTFWARPGESFTLRGPGGLAGSFQVSAGTSPAAGDCSRLGNLQLEAECVTLDVVDDFGSVVEGAWISGGVVDVVSSTDGAVCVPSLDGKISYTASAQSGAQRISVTDEQTIGAGGGTCFAGACAMGATLTLPGKGCVSGVVYDDHGDPAEGIRVVSSVFDSTITAADGSFSLYTGGWGTAAVWAADREIAWFADSGDGCAAIDLFSNAGAHPAAFFATDDGAFLVDEVDAVSTLLSASDGIYDSVGDLSASADANLILAVQYGVYVFASDFAGADYAKFDASYWSAARISPDATMVALQGYSTVNPAVSIFQPDGTLLRKISSNDAGTSPEGLAWSPDSAWVASTRKDGSIEVTPVSGARGPQNIAASTCTMPVWWDNDTVALFCDGGAWLAEMDGSGSVLWLDNEGVDDQIRAVTSGNRVAWTTGEALHLGYIDGTDDTVVYEGSAGTTYDDVSFDGTEGWLVAIVHDPSSGTDVIAIPDLPPFEVAWLTSTPSVEEIAAGWVE